MEELFMAYSLIFVVFALPGALILEKRTSTKYPGLRDFLDKIYLSNIVLRSAVIYFPLFIFFTLATSLGPVPYSGYIPQLVVTATYSFFIFTSVHDLKKNLVFSASDDLYKQKINKRLFFIKTSLLIFWTAVVTMLVLITCTDYGYCPSLGYWSEQLLGGLLLGIFFTSAGIFYVSMNSYFRVLKKLLADLYPSEDKSEESPLTT